MNRIVLIDNNQANLTLLWHLVREIKGHEAANFLNSSEALTWCRENKAELIIIDSALLEKNGMKLIAQFQENSDIPILMLTDSKQADIKYKALETGVTDFLNKPIDKSEFMIRVNNILAYKSSQKKLADQTRWLKEEVIKPRKPFVIESRKLSFA